MADTPSHTVSDVAAVGEADGEADTLPESATDDAAYRGADDEAATHLKHADGAPNCFAECITDVAAVSFAHTGALSASIAKTHRCSCAHALGIANVRPHEATDYAESHACSDKETDVRSDRFAEWGALSPAYVNAESRAVAHADGPAEHEAYDAPDRWSVGVANQGADSFRERRAKGHDRHAVAHTDAHADEPTICATECIAVERTEQDAD